MKYKKEQHRTRKEKRDQQNERRAKSSAANESRRRHKAEFPPRHVVEGTIRVSAKGIGYVEIEGMKETIEIDPADLNTALDQDRVRIILHGKKAGARQTGEVVKVLFRSKTKFVGILEREDGTFFLRADDPRMYRLILIPKQHLLGARAGEKVFVEMTRWTDPAKEPLGRVLRILGKPGEHDVEMDAIVFERGFTTTFDPDVEAEAEAIPLAIPPEEIARRRDFRNTITFTIDPKDAKDFDDALSWRKLDGGLVEVGIHIADVSHYVVPGSRIDREALERATSIYLVDHTIPMLPERLSNNICSLVPNEDRLTFSAVFTINEHAQVVREWFGRTIIHSQHRFTYEEAQEIIDGKPTTIHERNRFKEALLALNILAKQLREERIRSGAIAFEAEEIKFELDRSGKPVRIFKKRILDTNKLIEEFMLLANKQIAKLIATKDKRAESVFVYRVHDQPNEERMANLREFLRGIGYDLPLGKFGTVTSKSINEMLESVRGHAAEAMIQLATVRAMAKAVYTTKNIGHYGLGFAYYTHFTSPIRRYPDLMVHRLVANYLDGKPVSKKTLEREERLARYCSEMEIEAAEAERTSIRYKQCEYWAERIGYEFLGTISGVTEWGIYIEEPETKTEGMVHVKDIPNDFYFFEEKNYRLVGKQTGKSFRLGDRVRVKISSVDLKRKLIGMRLT